MDMQTIIYKKLYIVGMVLCLLNLPMGTVSAEKKIYNGTGEYTMSDYETPLVAEKRAFTNAQNHVLEQAGMFVNTYTHMESMVITDNSVNTIAAQSLKITKQSQRKEIKENGDVRIIVDITAEIDTDDIEKSLQQDIKQRIINEAIYSELQEKITNNEKETAELKRKIGDLKKEHQPLTELQIELKTKEQKRLSYQKVGEAIRINYNNEEYINKLKESITLYPQNTLALKQMATSYNMRHEYDESIKLCNRIFAINNDDMMSYVIRGMANFGKRDMNNAIKNFNSALKSNDRNIVKLQSCILLSRALALREINDYRNALIDLDKSIENNDNPNLLYLIYTNRGMIYGSIGDYQNAILDFNASIRLNPQYVDNYTSRARVYQQSGNIDEAINDCNKAIADGSKDINNYCIRGLCYLQKRDYEQAEKDFENALNINKESGYVYYCRGILYNLMKDNDKSIQNYNKALSLLSDNSDLSLVYMKRSVVYFEKGDNIHAIEDLEKSLELNPQGPYAEKISKILYSLKNTSAK